MIFLIFLTQLVYFLHSPALATDTWTPVSPGIDWLHRVTTGSNPQNLHVVQIDLTRSDISIQASADVNNQRGVVTSTFANNIGAIVAINGDWGAGSSSNPLGLAIGNGNMWNDHVSDTGVGTHWGYFACDIFNTCEYVSLSTSAWWFNNPTPTLFPYRYFNAVGANGLTLINDGVRGVGCYDVPPNARTAICTNQNKTQLTMMVIDDSYAGATGMTCDEMRDLAQEFGCWDAAMLDGGGSSTMYIDGSVRNTPSDGPERVRPNHIAVVQASTIDAECQTLQSGRWCSGANGSGSGNHINTCSGGRYLGIGDCALYGATCEEDGDWAYCVHFNCPDGSGTGSECLSSTEVASCNDGHYSLGDCSAFGLVCGEDQSGADCMASQCQAGPNSDFCVTSSTIGSCSDGAYQETNCQGNEQCEVVNASASCSVPDADSDGFDMDSDCDDSDATIYPGATETYYDGIDSNCDTLSDYDADEDGVDSRAHGGTDCDDNNSALGSSTNDADCDGVVTADDCNDTDASIYPGATEVPNDAIDQDCDGLDQTSQEPSNEPDSQPASEPDSQPTSEPSDSVGNAPNNSDLPVVKEGGCQHINNSTNAGLLIMLLTVATVLRRIELETIDFNKN